MQIVMGDSVATSQLPDFIARRIRYNYGEPIVVAKPH